MKNETVCKLACVFFFAAPSASFWIQESKVHAKTKAPLKLNVLLPSISMTHSHLGHHSSEFQWTGLVPELLTLMESSMNVAFTKIPLSAVCPLYCCSFSCQPPVEVPVDTYRFCEQTASYCNGHGGRTVEYLRAHSFDFVMMKKWFDFEVGDAITFDLIWEATGGQNYRAREQGTSNKTVDHLYNTISATAISTVSLYNDPWGAIVKKQKTEESMWNLFQPFSIDLLMAILVTIFAHAIIRRSVEHSIPTTPEKLLSAVCDAFLSFLAGTDCFDINLAAQVLGVGWCFFALIILATYTANLAAFMSAPNIQILGPQTNSDMNAAVVCVPYFSQAQVDDAIQNPTKYYDGEKLGAAFLATINAGAAKSFVAPPAPWVRGSETELDRISRCAKMLADQSADVTIASGSMVRQWVMGQGNCGDYAIPSSISYKASFFDARFAVPLNHTAFLQRWDSKALEVQSTKGFEQSIAKSFLIGSKCPPDSNGSGAITFRAQGGLFIILGGFVVLALVIALVTKANGSKQDGADNSITTPDTPRILKLDKAIAEIKDMLNEAMPASPSADHTVQRRWSPATLKSDKAPKGALIEKARDDFLQRFTQSGKLDTNGAIIAPLPPSPRLPSMTSASSHAPALLKHSQPADPALFYNAESGVQQVSFQQHPPTEQPRLSMARDAQAYPTLAQNLPQPVSVSTLDVVRQRFPMIPDEVLIRVLQELKGDAPRTIEHLTVLAGEGGGESAATQERFIMT